MAEKARLQFAPDGYRIAVGEEVSEASDFGVPVEFTSGDGTRYVGFADLGDQEDSEPETHLESWLYEAEPVECEPEDVDSFEDEEEEDEDEEDEPMTVNGGGKEAAD